MREPIAPSFDEDQLHSRSTSKSNYIALHLLSQRNEALEDSDGAHYEEYCAPKVVPSTKDGTSYKRKKCTNHRNVPPYFFLS
ncbi:hypothetical protein IKH83_03550 [Candidatus Saccharibacteria bacterium]|nr:hypothetical protein [Candidatus Saccharibacteria bacterium]